MTNTQPKTVTATPEYIKSFAMGAVAHAARSGLDRNRAVERSAKALNETLGVNMRAALHACWLAHSEIEIHANTYSINVSETTSSLIVVRGPEGHLMVTVSDLIELLKARNAVAHLVGDIPAPAINKNVTTLH